MKNYVTGWEQMSVQLASMDFPIDEAMVVKMYVESFGNQFNSPFETSLSVLLTRTDLTWQLVTWHLLLEFASQQNSRLMERGRGRTIFRCSAEGE